MSFIKYRLRDVASDFGTSPKEISEILTKYFEKPKSNTQVLTDQELNVVFDCMTRNHQIDSLEQVFAVKPAAPQQSAQKPAQAKPAQQSQQQNNRNENKPAQRPAHQNQQRFS